MMLIIIPEILLMMTVRAEMMMIKTGESAALECEGDWKYCEWRHHEKVGIDSEKTFMLKYKRLLSNIISNIKVVVHLY